LKKRCYKEIEMVGINISATRKYVVFYGDKVGGEALGMILVSLPNQLANDSVIAGVYIRKYMPKEHIILAVLAYEIVKFLSPVQELEEFWPLDEGEEEEEVVEEPVVFDSPEPLPFRFGDDEDGEQAIAEPV
jgi:hypothetical protein